MTQIPFHALPRGEQHAVLDALRQAGVKLPSLCMSWQQVEADASGPPRAWIVVTGANWCRTYPSRPGWEGELAQDLLAQVSAERAAPGAGA